MLSLLACATFAGPLPADYFQQRVDYRIDVVLDDSLHTLEANETIRYTNHSPDSLDFLWFHLWPNAYRDDQSALARQFLEHFQTRFHFADDDARGHIDGLDFEVDGVAAELEPHPQWSDVAKLLLPAPLAPDSTVQIETPFTVKLPEVFSRLGHTGKHYEITQWYPKPAVYDREGWHPMPYLNMGEFYSEFGSFDVRITLPAEYRVMATGDLVDGAGEIAWLDSLAAEGAALCALEDDAFDDAIEELEEAFEEVAQAGDETPSGRRKTLHFHQDRVHDFAWFADPNWIVRKGTLPRGEGAREITLWSFFLPDNAERWKDSITYLRRAGDWYSDNIGEYPYGHITAVDGDLSAGGGMEYPNITVISQAPSDDILEMVIEHEVGHNWFYGILASNERRHPWLDEGFNDYTDIRYWDHYHEGGAFEFSERLQSKCGILDDLQLRWVMGYLGYAIQAIPGDDQPLDLHSVDYRLRNYGAMVYVKTGAVLRYLHEYLGDDRMAAILHDYYDTWKFKHPGPDAFRRIVEAQVDENLDWFFEGCVAGTGVIDYAIGPLRDGRVELRNQGKLASPVQLAFYDAAGEEIERRWVDGFQGSRLVPAASGSARVLIDPDQRMPDIDRSNHASTRGFRLKLLVDQPEMNERELYWLPWIGTNRYNGLTPGLMLYGGHIPTHRGGFSVAPQWDFRHQRLVGELTARQHFYRVLGQRMLRLSASASRIWNTHAGRVELHAQRRAPLEWRRSTTLDLAYQVADIGGGALNPGLYDEGLVQVATLEAGWRDARSPFFRYHVAAGATGGLGEQRFLRAHTRGSARWRWADWARLRARLWGGSFLVDDSIPAQYRTHMAGGVDPAFDSPLVLDRGPGAGVFQLGARQFIEEGPALRGYYGQASTAAAWGLNLQHTLPLLPLSLFADAAAASDLEQGVLADAGLLLHAGPLELIAPLWMSWADEPWTNDHRRLADRLRFGLELDFTIGF